MLNSYFLFRDLFALDTESCYQMGISAYQIGFLNAFKSVQTMLNVCW